MVYVVEDTCLFPVEIGRSIGQKHGKTLRCGGWEDRTVEGVINIDSSTPTELLYSRIYHN